MSLACEGLAINTNHHHPFQGGMQMATKPPPPLHDHSFCMEALGLRYLTH